MKKQKDPAVSWYWDNWNGGTQTFSRAMKGAYMDLLSAQHSNGPLSLDEIKTVLGSDFGLMWPTLQKKFETDDNGSFYNARLEKEREKRKKFSEAQSDRAKKKSAPAKPRLSPGSPPAVPLLELELNTSSLNNTGKGGVGEKPNEEDPEEVHENLKVDSIWLEALAMQKKVSKAVIIEMLDKFKIHRVGIKSVWNGRKDYVEHFGNWLRKQDLKKNRVVL